MQEDANEVDKSVFGCFQFKQIYMEVCQHHVSHISTMLYILGVQHEEDKVCQGMKVIKDKQRKICLRIRSTTALKEGLTIKKKQ